MTLSDETGIVSALTWLVSRHGRYGRAVVLHDRVQQRKSTGEWTVRRLGRDVARGRGRGRARGRGTARFEPAVGLLAALVAVAAVLAILVVVIVHATLWALCAAGRSVRSIVHRPPREPVARPFGMRAS